MSSHCGQFDSGLTRRDWLSRLGLGVGGMALASLLGQECVAANANPFQGILDRPHHPPKAKRIIYLFMSGGPSQLDLFDYKPLLEKMHGENLPESVRMGQRLTGMSANQATFPLVKCPWKFAQHGKSGAWVSELLPWTAKMVDKLAWLHGCYTEHINHDPAITFFQTGSHLAGRPSMGSWLSYGLGSANENLPAFVVLISKDRIDQPLYARLWGNGFLAEYPSRSAIPFRKGPGVVSCQSCGRHGGKPSQNARSFGGAQCRTVRRIGDPEINSRVAQYEMAYRMQTSVPEVMDLSNEPESTFELYGAEAKTPGTFAANCLLARRLAERDVRFIQLYHPGWDHHGNLPKGITKECKDVDQASYALVTDLEQRGLLKIRLSYGAASSAEPTIARANSRRTILAATIIRAASRCGWPAAAQSQARRSARPTSSATTPSQAQPTCMTFKRHCCICWGSTTSGSRINSKVGVTASPTSTAN